MSMTAWDGKCDSECVHIGQCVCLSAWDGECVHIWQCVCL